MMKREARAEWDAYKAFETLQFNKPTRPLDSCIMVVSTAIAQSYGYDWKFANQIAQRAFRKFVH